MLAGSDSPPSDDEFRTVFSSPHPLSTPPAPTNVSIPLQRATNVSITELSARIERELDAFDDKRQSLTRLIKSLRQSPSSLRINRAIDGARHEAARVSRRIHSLFHSYHQSLSQSQSVSVTQRSMIVDQWMLYYQQYAACSDIVHALCLQSINLQQSLSQSQSSQLAQRRPVQSLSSVSSSIDDDVSDDECEQAEEVLPRLTASIASETNTDNDTLRLISMVRDVASLMRGERRSPPEPRAVVARPVHIHRLPQSKDDTAAFCHPHYQRTIGLTVCGAGVGAIIGGPIGALVGAKTAIGLATGAISAAISGSFLGALTGSVAGIITGDSRPHQHRYSQLSHSQSLDVTDGGTGLSLIDSWLPSMPATQRPMLDNNSDAVLEDWPLQQPRRQPVFSSLSASSSPSSDHPDPLHRKHNQWTKRLQ